jgi:hypothetical protein
LEGDLLLQEAFCLLLCSLPPPSYLLPCLEAIPCTNLFPVMPHICYVRLPHVRGKSPPVLGNPTLGLLSLPPYGISGKCPLGCLVAHLVRWEEEAILLIVEAVSTLWLGDLSLWALFIYTCMPFC